MATVQSTERQDVFDYENGSNDDVEIVALSFNGPQILHPNNFTRTFDRSTKNNFDKSMHKLSSHSLTNKSIDDTELMFQNGEYIRSSDGAEIGSNLPKLIPWKHKKQYSRMNDNDLERIDKFRRPWCMLKPDSLYQYIGDALTLYVAIAVPLFVSFQYIDSMEPEDWYVLNCLVDVLFIIDLIVQFNSGYKSLTARNRNSDVQGEYSNINSVAASSHVTNEVIYDRVKILKRYAKGYLVFDIVASVPMTMIFGGRVWTVANKIARLSRLHATTRSLQLIKQLANRTSHQNQKHFLLGFYNIAKVGSFLFLVLHWCACGWHFVAHMESYENSWIYKDRQENAGFGSLYVSSFYWTVTTLCTVGYGDISANTSWERIYTITIMLCGAVLSALAIASVSHIVAGVVANRTRADHISEHAESFIWKHSLPQTLAKQVRQSLNLSGETEKASLLHDQETMDLLPTQVRTSVLQYVHDSQIEKISFLREIRHVHPVFVTTFASMLQPSIRIPAGEVIYIEGAESIELWFLVTGSVVLTTKGDVVSEIYSDQYFGDVGSINLVPRINTARTLTPCELVSISTADVQTLLRNYPELMNPLKKSYHGKDRNDTHISKHDICNSKCRSDGSLRLRHAKSPQVDELNCDSNELLSMLKKVSRQLELISLRLESFEKSH